MKWSKWCAAMLAVALLTLPAQAVVTINEIRIDQSGTDYDEYFELAGDPSESLDGLTYLVIGDTGTANSGIIECVVDLTGLSIPADGHFFAVEADLWSEDLAPLADADLQLTSNELNFENSDNVTHLLVEGFIGLYGDDLDIDDDGVLDVTPWTTIVDLIALVEEPNPPANTEYHYGPPQIGPDGIYVPAHVFRLPDASGGWQIGSFYPDSSTDTPGTENKDIFAESGATLAGVGDTAIVLDLSVAGVGGATPRVLDPIPSVGTLYDDTGTITTGTPPHEVVGDLKYDPVDANYTGTVDVHFDAIDGGGQTADPAVQIVCVQGDEVVISEIMHSPANDYNVYEYIEIYNYGPDPVNLWGLSSTLMYAPPFDAPVANLQGRSIPAGEWRIIAPSTTPVNDEAFRCEWKLDEASHIIRVDVDSWQGLFSNNDLVRLYEDTGGTPGLLDAVWVRHDDISWVSFSFPEDLGHAVAVIKAMLFGNNLTPLTNDEVFFIPPWDKLGNTAGYVNEAVQVSESGLNYGNPGWVPQRDETWDHTAQPGCLVGECCLPDGSCIETYELDCTDNECGLWSPDDGDCLTPPPVVCNIPTGACCTLYGDCWTITQCDCDKVIALMPGTTYAGDGTDCVTEGCPGPASVSINELDYDNPSTDYVEFIELLGPPGTDLTGWRIELYEGDTGEVDATILLTGSIPVDSRFYVIGSATVPNVDQLFDNDSNNLENSREGIVLIDGTARADVIVDLAAYEGSFVGAAGTAADGLTLPDIGTDAGRGGSIQRIYSGGDWMETPVNNTPGETNAILDDTCRDVAGIKERGVDLGVRLCDVVVTTTIDMSGNTSFKTFYVQDTSGPLGDPRGVAINGTNEEIDAVLNALGGVSDGDQIDLSGTTDEPVGLFLVEDGDMPLELDAIDSSGPVPATTPITVAEMQDDSTRAEELESVLVEMSCVVFDDAGGTFASATNYFVQDGSGMSATVRIAASHLDLVGTTIPTGFVNVAGLLTQYSPSQPPEHQYSIRPRSLADITTCAAPPTGSCCNGAVCTEVDFVACAAVPGVYRGNGTNCAANPCPIGPCCMPTGGCWVTDETECIAEGGVNWDGDVDTCAEIVCAGPSVTVLINEIRVNEPGDPDASEYFELLGPGGTSLAGLTYLVIGDTGTGNPANSGVIEEAVALTGQSVPPDGYFVAAESSFDTGTLGNVVDLDLGATGLNFENSDNVTHLLVATFSGSNGDDLDTNDDGTLDSTPWDFQLDLIALVEEPNPPLATEYHYGDPLAVPYPTAIGPDGTDQPAHVYRYPDAQAWQIGDFEPVGQTDTPGQANQLAGPCVATDARSLKLHGAGELYVTLGVSGGIDPRLDGITKLEIDVDDAGGFAGGVTVVCSASGDISGTVSATSVNVNTVTVELSAALPDGEACTVTLDCGAQVCVIGLEGDTDGNAVVATTDAGIIKPRFGDTADNTNARFDVDHNGTIATTDFGVVKPKFGNAADPCP